MLISRELISSRDSRIEAASYLTVICLPTVWQLVCIRFIIPESRVPEWRYNVKQLISEWPVSPCGKGATDKLDCKTAVFFANESDGQYSNEGSWASEKTAMENGERLTLEDHAYGASRLPKTTVFQSTDKYSISRHSLSNFLHRIKQVSQFDRVAHKQNQRKSRKRVAFRSCFERMQIRETGSQHKQEPKSRSLTLSMLHVHARYWRYLDKYFLNTTFG